MVRHVQGRTWATKGRKEYKIRKHEKNTTRQGNRKTNGKEKN